MKRSFIKWQVPFILLAIIFSMCTDELAPLPEKESESPSLTIRATIDQTLYDDEVEIDNNREITHLIEVGTGLRFFVEASDVKGNYSKITWYINNEEQIGSAFFGMGYIFDAPGEYSISVEATANDQTETASMNIYVYEIESLTGRALENGTYVASFDADDDGQKETFTYTFSGTNAVELSVSGMEEGPAENYTLTGTYEYANPPEARAGEMRMYFLLKGNPEDENRMELQVVMYDRWTVFDYNGETYLNMYPLIEDNPEEMQNITFEKYFNCAGGVDLNGEYTDWWSWANFNTTEISYEHHFFKGIAADSLPIVYTMEGTIDWGETNLVQGDLKRIDFMDHNYLFYTASDEISPAMMHLKKQ